MPRRGRLSSPWQGLGCAVGLLTKQPIAHMQCGVRCVLSRSEQVEIQFPFQSAVDRLNQAIARKIPCDEEPARERDALPGQGRVEA